MKKLRLVTVGKPKAYFKAAEDEYVKRLAKFCAFELIQLGDVAGEEEIKRESEAILAKIAGFNILLDVEGRLIDSNALSRLIDSAYLKNPVLTFIIGGSRGVNAAVKAAVDDTLSFGRVTFPHQMMRVIALEQFYRAFTIAAGMPYHK